MSSLAFAFDSNNPNAEKAAADQAGAFITNIDEASRNGINALVSRSFRDNISPHDLAGLIKTFIGVTDQQAQAALNYREELMSDKTLSAQSIDAALAKFADKQLSVRAGTIARTEVMDAINGGARAGWLQAREKGYLGPDAVIVWHAAVGCCKDCDALDGVEIGLDDFFDIDGEDRDGPPAHPNCRCTISVRASSSSSAEEEIDEDDLAEVGVDKEGDDDTDVGILIGGDEGEEEDMEAEQEGDWTDDDVKQAEDAGLSEEDIEEAQENDVEVNDAINAVNAGWAVDDLVDLQDLFTDDEITSLQDAGVDVDRIQEFAEAGLSAQEIIEADKQDLTTEEAVKAKKRGDL